MQKENSEWYPSSGRKIRNFLAAGNFLRVFCRFDVLSENPEDRHQKKFGYINIRRDTSHTQISSARKEEWLAPASYNL